MIRVGVLGGAFDPVHIGHLILAETAADLLHLDQVHFAPAADPPHKRGKVIAPASHRLAMLDLALAGNDRLRISRIDLDRPGPHYTADMVAIMAASLEPEDELWFLMGLDSLIDLPNWHAPDRLRRSVRLAAATRPGYVLDWGPLEAALPGIGQQVTLLPMPGLSIASHELRQRVAAGRSIRYLVPDAIRHYIGEQRLYI